MTMASCEISCDIRLEDYVQIQWQNIDKNIKKFIQAQVKILTPLLYDYSILDNKPYHLDILLSHDMAIQVLNKQWRDIDKATNILSFENGDMNEHNILILGDLILSVETIIREANDDNKNIKHHITHLLLHGILHLFGFDHERDNTAEEMEAIEIDILARINIDNPY